MTTATNRNLLSNWVLLVSGVGCFTLRDASLAWLVLALLLCGLIPVVSSHAHH